MTPHVIAAEFADTVRRWLRERGGIAIWRSVNLSNPGASWTTPLHDGMGNPMPRPNWQSDITPERVITNPAEVVVISPVEVERLPVSVERHGLMLKCSTASSKKIRARLAELGDGHFYQFDYSTQECVFYREGDPRLLIES